MPSTISNQGNCPYQEKFRTKPGPILLILNHSRLLTQSHRPPLTITMMSHTGNHIPQVRIDSTRCSPWNGAAVIHHYRRSDRRDVLSDDDRLLRSRLLTGLRPRHRRALIGPLHAIEIAQAWRTAVAESRRIVRIGIPARRHGRRWRDWPGVNSAWNLPGIGGERRRTGPFGQAVLGPGHGATLTEHSTSWCIGTQYPLNPWQQRLLLVRTRS
jgi:hypothetical protein